MVLVNSSSDEEETMETYRPIAHLDRLNRNHLKIKRSAIFIRAFREFYQRISKNIRRRTETAPPAVRHDIYLEDDEECENIYEHIPWEFTCNRNAEDTTNVFDGRITRLIERSPPQITWKHSWSINETKDALLNSPFSSIPTEIAFQIFEFLSIHDLGNVSLVCRHFKMIIDQDDIWRSKCNSKLRFDILLILILIRKIASNKLLSKSFKEIYMDWKYEEYLRNREFYENEVNGGYKSLFDLLQSVQSSSVVSLEKYPVRLDHRILLSSVAGFKQHPNTLQAM